MLKFLQIWIIPERAGVEPRYDQTLLGPIAPDSIVTVVGPKDAGAPLWIHQQAWLSMGHGSITVGGESESHHLGKRDGLGVVDASRLEITTDTDATFIVIEVPMG